MLLRGRLLVPLLLAVARLLGLVAGLLLGICCWLGVTTLVVTSRLAAGIVTNETEQDKAISQKACFCEIHWSFLV